MVSYLSLLLAVTTVVQDTAPPPQAPSQTRRNKPKRAHVMTLAPYAIAVPELLQAAAAISATQIDVQALTAQAPLIAAQAEMIAAQAPAIAAQAEIFVAHAPAIQAHAPVIAVHAPMIAMDVERLLASAAEIDIGPIDAFRITERDELEEPDWKGADAQSQGDPADSVYRAGRQALNNNQYSRAAELFSSIRDRFPRSAHVPDTYYWQAYALYRDGSDDALRAARQALKTQKDKYDKAATRRDAEVLLRRVQGELAKRGDSEAAEQIAEDVEEIAPARPPREPRAPRPPRETRPGRSGRSADCDDEDDIRIAALNAVLQMDAERAVPLLKTVLARRDEGSACLRRKAIWLVSQKRSAETARILLDAVRNDPDREVREQGVFWLSQVPGEETVAALDSILRDADDPEVQEKAIFALSQHRSPRSGAILRAFAERRDVPQNLRENAIFWLGQRRSTENAQFLKDLYAKVDSDALKEKIIFSLSQQRDATNYRWLMDIALNERENIELRKNALFWANQGGNRADIADLVRLYDSMKDREMRKQLIWVYSQRREEAALDKLFEIGKNDPDRELRKSAIFWIGQSRSPRAAQYLQELINQ